jgi:hypothetical protein
VRAGTPRRAKSQAGRLSPADISRDVGPKSCHTSARWSVNGYVALITDEASRSRVKDHYTKELQVAVRVPLSVRKKTGRRLRIDQLWPKLLNLARKDLRSLDGQKPGFCSEARRMFRPVCPRSVLSQLNCIWVRKTSVDSEISIIDFLGVERRKYRERESKKNQISWAHEEDCTNDYVSPSCQLDAIFHTLPFVLRYLLAFRFRVGASKLSRKSGRLVWFSGCASNRLFSWTWRASGAAILIKTLFNVFDASHARGRARR